MTSPISTRARRSASSSRPRSAAATTSTPARSPAISATHIPGNPTIVPQNMPAAGGLGAANHLNNVAAKDGTVIALFQNTVPLEPFFENKQAQFDAAKIGWLGTPTTETAHLHDLAQLEDQDACGCAAAGVRRRRGRRRLHARLLWPRVQPDLQFQGPLHHRLSGPERDSAGARERRGRSDGVTVLVEPEDRATRLVQGGQDPLPVPVRLGPAS